MTLSDQPALHADAPPSVWVSRLATLLAIGVFPLVIVGAGVTSKDAGMAFPDWPTSDGHLLNPPGWLAAGDKLWEHGHRLIGWTVGMLAIAVVGLAIKRGASKSVRILSVLTLLAIIVQGVMGGLRVTEISTTLAMIHGIWGQLCFCLAASTALISAVGWAKVRPIAPVGAGPLRKLCAFVSFAIVLQLAFGAALRHFGDSAALVLHVLWSIVVALFVGWAALWVLAQFPTTTMLSRPAKVMGVLMALQLLLGGLAWLVTLGGGSWSVLWLWLLPTAHVAVGALILVSSVLVTLGVFRHTRLSETQQAVTPPAVGVVSS